jgi:hypothetical protein
MISETCKRLVLNLYPSAKSELEATHAGFFTLHCLITIQKDGKRFVLASVMPYSRSKKAINVAFKIAWKRAYDQSIRYEAERLRKKYAPI